MNRLAWEITAPLSPQTFAELDGGPTDSPLAPPGAALIVVKRGPNAGSRFTLDQPSVAAGRHPDSDIFLDDITASRRHAEFCSVDGEFRVVDVGSLNGTYLNRRPVRSATLTSGDEIAIGRFRLVFLCGGHRHGGSR